MELKLESSMFDAQSFNSERLVEHYQKAFANHCAHIKEIILSVVKEMPEKREQAQAEADRIIDISKSLHNEYYNKRSRVANWAVVGPANFPVARNNKKIASAEKVAEKIDTLIPKLIERAKKRLRPDLKKIMAGDDDAVTRLEAKIAKNEDLQKTMKAINKICRSKESNEEKFAIIKTNFPSFSDDTINKILNPIASYYSQGFQGFELTNLSATIRNDKKRLVLLKRNKSTADSERELADGTRIVISNAENRVKIFYNDKPSAEIRTALKSNGFRWAPSEGSWKAYINSKALNFIESLK